MKTKIVNMLLALLLVLVFVFGVTAFAACGGDKDDPGKDDPIEGTEPEPEPETFTVTFNANGGMLTGNATVTVEEGKKITNAPTASKEGSEFDGWFDAATGGKEINLSTYTVTANVTLYAQYTLIEAHVCDSVCPICGKCYDLFCEDPVCEDKCGAIGESVVFEAEDAKLEGGKKGALKLEDDNAEVDPVVYVAGLNSNEGASVTFTVSSDEAKTASLYASVSRRAREISLTSDAFAITVNGERLTTESAVPESGTDGDDWRHFVDVGLGCIQLVKGDNTIVFTVLPGDEKCVNLDNITLTVADGITPEPEPETFTVTFNANGGTLTGNATVTVEEGGKITGAPTASKTNATFNGWYDAATGGNKVDLGTYTVTGNVTLYAQYTENAEPEPGPETYTVTFNANGGELTGNAAVTVEEGGKITGAPTASKDNATFNGWYDEATGGNRIDLGTYIVTGNVVLYAHWSVENVYEAEDAVLYSSKGNLQIKDNGDNGETYVDGVNTNKGAKIEFIVYADADTTATLVAYFSQRVSDFPVSNMQILVNGEPFETDGVVPGTGNGDKWRAFVPVELGEIELNEGRNTVSFAVTSENDYGGANFDKIVLIAEEQLPETNALVLEAENGVYRPTQKIEPGNGGTGQYLGINQKEGTTIDFAVDAEEACTQELYVRLSLRAIVTDNVQSDILIKNVYKITVNGIEFDTGNAVVGKPVSGNNNWGVYSDVYLGEISLEQGVNTIMFAVITKEDIGSNIDYLKLVGKNEVTETDLNTEFVLDEQKFEAEFAQAVKADGSVVGLDKDVCTAQDGVKSMMIGTNKNLGQTITFTVKANETKTVDLYAAITVRLYEDNAFGDIYKLTVNGEEQTVSGNIPSRGDGKDYWRESEEVKLCTLDLEEGTVYTITFEVISGEEGGGNFDYIKLAPVHPAGGA